MKKVHNLEKITGGGCNELLATIVATSITNPWSPNLPGLVQGYNIACR